MKIIGQNKLFNGTENNIVVCNHINHDYGQLIVDFLKKV